MKQIRIKISPTGEIEAETFGMKGKECLKYISVIEGLTDAACTDSAFTKEYFSAETETGIEQTQEVNV